MIWQNRRALVTGATGLVGSWLCRRLLDYGARVVALVRDWDPQSELIRSGRIGQCSVITGRLEDYATLERALSEHAIDTVFHLGAQTIVDTARRSPLATFESNIRGTYNLLEACRVHHDLVTHIVVASSDKAYGEVPELPYTEIMPLRGCFPYDVSKSCADLIASAYARSYGLPVAVARCGNIFGGGDLNWSRIVPATIRAALAGTAPVLRSDGTFVRDYIYVEDIVDAYVSLAARADERGIRGEAFNFSVGRPLTVLEITLAALAAAGRPDLEPVIQGTASREIKRQYLDSAKAARVLGWQPGWPLERGLVATIDWYREYLSGTAHLAVAAGTPT
jgi:CDP-glucose 4,6-dehydratase